MKSFLEIAKPVVESGVYMSGQFSEDSNKTLASIQKTLGIKDPIVSNKLHVTIVYSRKDIELYPESDLNEPANVVDIDIWDTKYGKTLVAKLDSSYLTDRFQQAMDSGATYDHDEYKPHVTLSYNSGLTESVAELRKRLQFPYKLTIVSEKSEALNLDKKLKDLTEHVVQRGEKWVALSKDRSKELGSFDSKEEAIKALDEHFDF